MGAPFTVFVSILSMVNLRNCILHVLEANDLEEFTAFTLWSALVTVAMKTSCGLQTLARR